MSAGFTKSLAERLDRESQIRVKEAVADEKLEAGTVYLAPGDYHMQVVRKADGVYVALDQRPPVLGVRPCVDNLFLSVAEAYGPKALGVVLTGMGRDGAKGLKAMKGKLAVTLAQDEASSVVYGMPRAAFAAGCVDKVLDLGAIAPAIVELLP
jgi:two-component system chemotaxis response regulator CheB